MYLQLRELAPLQAKSIRLHVRRQDFYSLRDGLIPTFADQSGRLEVVTAQQLCDLLQRRPKSTLY